MSARKLFNIREEQIYNTAPSFTACSTNYDFLDTYWFFILIIDILHLDNVSLLHTALNNLFWVKKSNLNFHANFENNWVLICKNICIEIFLANMNFDSCKGLNFLRQNSFQKMALLAKLYSSYPHMTSFESKYQKWATIKSKDFN